MSDAPEMMTPAELAAAYAAATAPPPEPQSWLRVVAGKVVNVEAYLEPPTNGDGVTWLQNPRAGIGWTYDGVSLTAPK